MKKIVIANKKGGVGKTTTVQNLSAGLAMRGKKVLSIDMDAQSNLTTAWSVKNPKSSILDVLRGTKNWEDVAIRVNESKNGGSVYLVPAVRELAAMPELFATDFGKEMLLKEALEKLSGFDYVLIDSPPTLDLISVNTYVASDLILIPVQCEFYSLEGLYMMQSDIEKVKARLNKDLQVLGILPTFFDKRKKLCKDVLSLLKDDYKDLVTSTIIRDTVALAEAPSNGESIFTYDKKSYGYEDYNALVEEIINKLEFTNG